MLLQLELRLPEEWTADPDPRTVPPSPLFVRAGIKAQRVYQFVHTGDDARVAIYRLRAPRSALDEVTDILVRDVGAGRVPNGLIWLATGPGWYSFNAIQEGRDVAGPALLWSSYLPEQGAPERMREIGGALDSAAWTL
ncbi:hypothetical protein [Ruania alba]|uniref:Uncharacterized protein n=1 Tax=Ruania alba TaxID=648782 RepID=A0A1H5M1M8_9MICO|nr:hypothetical protein [Ruania alba]SEE83229.1 hypothetical protein SAMN04488554_3101 [Ruania alba]